MDNSHLGVAGSDGSASAFGETRSAAYLSLALAAAEMGTWDWDIATDLATVCARTGGFFGLPAGTYRWAELFALVHPDDAPLVQEQLAAALAQRRDYTAEYRVRRADGSYLWLSCRGRAAFYPGGQPQRMHGVACDISDRKSHEAELERHARMASERAEELQAVLDAAPVAIWIAHDPECRRITGNAYADRLMRVPPRGNVSLTAPPGERVGTYTITRDGVPIPAAELPAQRVGRSGEAVREEVLEFQFPDDTTLHLVQNAVPLYTPDGRVRGVVATGAEISTLLRAQTAARESEARFGVMADAVTVPIWLADVRGRTVFANRAFTDFFGPGILDDAGEHNWQVAIHADDITAYAGAFTRAIEQRRPFAATARVRAPDGHWRWIASSAVPLHDADGRFTGMVGISPDVTEIKRAEELMASEARRLETLVEQRTARLQESLAEMEAFSYNISHDLRAPLRAMHSFGRFLAEEESAKLSAHGRDYLARIIAATARMDRLIQDVLVYSRAARTELKLEPVDLARLLPTLFDAYPHLRERPAEFDIAPGLPVVLGNDAALLQCFANVLGNAVKFVAPGVPPVVRVWAETAGGRARVFIRDNGIGIPAEAHARIFDMFYRLNAAYDGTGIGLSVTRKSIERMGGRVGVESAPGCGSTFHFDLQLAP